METYCWDITKCDICHDETFEQILASIHYSLLCPEHQDDDVIEISPLRIVSVVVCSKFIEDTKLNLPVIYEELKKTEEVLFQEKRPEKKSKSKMFYNCMKWTVQIKDGNTSRMNVSIKCFPNGKFQFAGFNTIHSIKLLPRIITNKIRQIEGGIQPQNSKLEEPKIIQINSTFYILKDKKKWQLKQLTLNKLLLEKEGVSVGGKILSSSFMPEKYPGINAKFKVSEEKTLTMLIFATGSVLINGYNDITQYREAYYMLCNLIHTHRDSLIAPNLLN